MTLPKQNPTNQNQPQNSVAKSAPENKDTSQLETLLGLMAELNLVNLGSKSEESTNNSDNVVAEKLDGSEKSGFDLASLVVREPLVKYHSCIWEILTGAL
jgi:hypothetical protein